MSIHRAAGAGSTRAAGAWLRRAALVLALTAGCRPVPEIGPEVPGGGGGGTAATFTEIRERILEPRCASGSCHGDPPFAEPMLLGPASYDALVGAPAQQVQMSPVEPFSLEGSYLVYKLRNTAGDVGGIDTPMPIGDSDPLDESEIAAIEAWILEGAPND